MIVAYIVNSFNLTIRDIFNVESYKVEGDIDFGGKSTVSVARKPILEEKDFVILKKNGESFFVGICESVDNNNGEDLHIINCIEKENIFDRKIIIDEYDEAFKSTVGVEDFIENCIIDNFIDSDDALLNLDYIEVKCLTHTPVVAAVPTEHGIFNLKTYMANVMENYGVFYDFDFESESRKLIINIEKKSQKDLKIDALSTDVNNYVENYEVDALSKLTVVWKQPDTTDDETGVVTKVGETTILNYYLRNDRSVTTDKDDPDRAKGSCDIEYLEAESSNEVAETVTNAFKSNSYNHSIELEVYGQSTIYPAHELYVGHECQIKTKAHGVKKSIITKINRSSDSDYISLKFGNMAVKLIEKLRKERI
jgi:hypothetical protein